jgi:two-component system, OmpR family, phosphate regulon sensor histidine kinase PhoR
MKFKKDLLFILLTGIAFVAILGIQYYWILKTANTKEAIFNEKVHLALTAVSNEISTNTSAKQELFIAADKRELIKTDSILRHYLKLYDININYTFEVSPWKNQSANPPIWQPQSLFNKDNNYQACISDPNEQEKLLLQLKFPEKEEFIRAEMGPLFILSVGLILLVMVVTFYTYRSLQKEKELAANSKQFLSNIIHEFKTPLTNIALAGKMLRNEVIHDDKEKRNRYIDILLVEKEKLNNQVEQLLQLSSLEKGGNFVQLKPIELNSLLKEIERETAVQIEEAKGEININYSPDNIVINADKELLKSAIINLVDNAIKYSNGNPRIEINLMRNENHLLISIKDNGIGIAPKYREKVFERYFRVPTGNIHTVKGFGVGLSYVQVIIAQHKGTISLASEEGKGSLFTIKLPLVNE